MDQDVYRRSAVDPGSDGPEPDPTLKKKADADTNPPENGIRTEIL